MGRDDGTGHAIPKLLDAKGRVQCDSCHSSTGVAHSTDTSSQAYPSSESTAAELVAVYASDPATWTGRVSVYGRALSGADPRALIGPRQYGAARGTGPSGAGDVDIDGRTELVVASATSAYVTVYAPDPLTGLGLQPVICAIPTGLPAAALAVADVVEDISLSQPEVLIVDGDGNLSFYRVDVPGSTLVPMADPVDVGAPGPWGLATGDVTGTDLSDVVVTNRSAGTLTIATGGLFGSALTTTTGWAGLEPVAPSIGNVWGGPAVVVCDASAIAEATATVRVFDGAATLIPGAEYDVHSGAGLPSASAIGDVFSAKAGDEVALTFVDPNNGDSTIVVVPQVGSGPGLDVLAVVDEVTGAGFYSGSLLIGDVEGDAANEIVVGSGGMLSTAVPPSVQVWRGTGAALATPPGSYVGGGTDMAGLAPSLVLADFGPVLPSRHPIDEVAAASHVSTEAAPPFTRHVTCSDCHNTHEANTAAADAPTVPGPLAGAWGLVGGTTARASTQIEICYKCHSSTVGGRQDVKAQFGPAAISGHAVSGASTSTVPTATFVPAILPGDPVWTPSSILYCTDCHGDSTTGGTPAQKRELHKSASAPLLNGSYLGVNPDAGAVVCYECHSETVYADGSTDSAIGMSYFQETLPNDKRLHSFHVSRTGGKGLSCSSCHVTHGSSTQPYLLRDDIVFSMTGDHTGSCTTVCHLGLAHSHSYPSNL
jgi:hypothetical protein